MTYLRYFTLLIELFLIALPIGAQEVSPMDTDSLITLSDTVSIDSVSPDPEWYVAPIDREIPYSPRRAAANCPVDSVLTFNVDSVLKEVTVYEYGDTTRTMVWTVNADGSRVGKSRTESASTATTTYSATYAWDATTNNWKGTKKEEHTYNSSNKEIERILYNTWFNNDWLADTKYTWVYDTSNREIEYTTYTRNTSTNQLVPSKQRIREWYNASKMTLDIQYTAHNGTTWSAGTKKMYAYDASANQIEYTYYSSLSNGNWVGSTHEVWEYTSGKKTYYEKQTWSSGNWVNSTKEIWAYNGPSAKQTLYEKHTWSSGAWIGSAREIWEFNGPSSKQTLHEKYGWANGDWSITLQENLRYDDAGNNDLVENYTITSGTWKGTKKEEYTYNSANKKTRTIRYKWSNGWVYNTRLDNDYDAAGNTTETANYLWNNDAWKGTGTRTLTTYNSSNKEIEKITQTWPSGATDWVNATRKTTEYEGARTTQEASFTWSTTLNDWVGTSRSDWHYNTAGQNDTIKTYTPNGTEWIFSSRTVKTYDAKGNTILTHNASWNGTSWVMTSMTKLDLIYDGSNRQLLRATWQCSDDSVWIGIQKDTAAYTVSGKILFTAVYDSWANNDWVAYYKVEYEYDTSDRKILEQRFDWNVNAWKGNYRNEIGYDDQGREILTASYTGWDNLTGTWIGSQKTEKTYGANNQIASTIMSVWGTNTWRLVFRYLYTYDASGREIVQTVEHFENNAWVYTEKYEKEYSGNTQVKDNSYIWLNNKWVFSSRNESYYDNDAQAKLRRQITGSWNNGVLSSFADKYYDYACDPHSFTIRFVNYDGTELSSEKVDGGTIPTYKGETPVREATPEYTYTFEGWTPAISPATANTTYTATFTQTKNKYTVKFLNYDGTELQSSEVEFGEMPTYEGETPIKDATTELTFTFASWTPAIATVNGEATYTATFTESARKYTIQFFNYDGTELQSSEVAFGEMPTYEGETPTKDATTESTFTFASWTPAIATVNGDATYTATFTESVRKYTIQFVNYDGTELQSSEVAFGEMPTYEGETPTKEATTELTFTFANWTPVIATVNGDATYTATFTESARKYMILFLNYDGSELQSSEVEYGTVPTYAGAIPTKDADAQFTYTFSGWGEELIAVTGTKTYTAQFSAEVNKYTIVFQNYDGTELQSSEVAYGETPVYTGETPTKPADAQDSYIFAGWEPEIVTVTGAVTYTAQFTGSKNIYTITFKNGEDVLQSSEVEYGETPVYEGETPTKASDAQYTYTFSGWDPEIVAVEGAQTYSATFSSTLNKYVITFKNGEEVLQSTEVEYGTMPEYTGETPTKDDDEQYTYEFADWGEELAAVTGEKTYTAQFSNTLRKYTITFVNGEEVLQSSEVEYGTEPVYAGAIPTKDADAQFTYTFSGWGEELVAVTGTKTYTAQFSTEVNKYTIVFQNYDGTELQSSEVAYGETPVYTGETPTKPADAQDSYIFAGWEPEIVAVTGAVTYTAQFTGSKNKYTITFKNGEDVLQSSEVEYGETPVYEGVTPTKASDAQYTYTFSGWDPEIVAVEGAQTYSATFSSTLNKYVITFKNGEEVLQSSEVEYGTVPEYTGETPTKDDDEQYTYEFADWGEELAAVTGEKTYTAQFSNTLRKYTITFVNGEEVLQSSEVEYGTEPVYSGAIPTKDADAQFTYTFSGWDEELVAVTGTKTYTAQFSTEVNKYTIVFQNYDGTELQSSEVAYGETPVYTGETPTKPADAQDSYIFAGWEPAVVAVTGAVTYTAQFTGSKNKYTITFKNGEDVLQSSEVEYGETPVYEGETPTKASDAQYTYTFSGWDPEIVAVEGVQTYSATFSSTLNKYVITFKNGEEVLQSSEVEYGTVPVCDDAVKEATAEWTYSFTGWDPTIVSVTEETTYTAQFDSTKNTYTITWLNADGSEINHETLEYGATPTHDDAVKQATAEWTYTFVGWEPEIVDVVGDATYTAQFDSTKNSYNITWLNWDNSIIEETTVEYGVVPSYDEPTKAATDEYTYTFAGWDPAVVIVNGDATYTAQFDSVKNTYAITWNNDDHSLIDETDVEYGVIPTHDDAVKEATAEWTYTFTGWDPAIVSVTGEATYTAQFDSVKNNYTITWLNDDYSLIDQVDVEYGIVPSREDPTKENTAEYTYTFAGWDPEVVAVSENATYTATYDSVKNSYTITWLNWDNSLIDETTVEYGVEPTLDDPTMDATDEYTYTFVGWNPAVVAVTGEATYTAQFDSVKNTYTITWLDDQGAEIDQTTEEFGATPTHDDAVKEATAEWTYTFTGWDPAITEVTGEATYTAQFDSVKNSYTVTWLNDDGSEIDHETLEYGSTPTHTDIDKEATAEWTYTFTGWEPEIVDVVGDATYTAQFDSVKNSYTITWLNWDNSQIDETIVEYGVVPTHDDPTKEATNEWTYTFAGWDPEVIAVIGEATYTAQFDSIKNTYTITWLDDQGAEIDQTTEEFGATPTHDDAVKEATAEWTYTFTGWDPAIASVTGDATYAAQFDSTKNSYTITWMNEDGSEIDHETLEYGSTPAHADIDKENTAEWTYTFVGWEPEIVDVVGDATYTAQFDSVKNSYTITWLNWDESLIDESDVEYGVVPTHEDPTKEATNEWTYTFTGWDPEVVAVIGDATYTATFDSVKNTYTITWLNDDNSLIDQTDVEYGATPAHDDAVKEATAEWTYTFTGWDPAITEVTGDATYAAQFDSTKNSYTVTWLNDDGSEIDHETLEYGSTPAHADIDKEATAEWTYTFAGWEPEIVDVVGDATYTATFDSVKNSYTITWLNWDESLIDQTNVEYGVVPTHEDPTKAETEKYSYTFAGWEPEVVAVIGDATYTATFDSTETTIYYHISITVDDAAHGKAGFVYADSESSTLLTDNEVASGTWIELRAIASDDWHFDHWSDGDTASVRPMEVTEDMQFTAYFASNCGDYPTLPVVSLYDWLLMLDVRSIHAMGYTFSEEDVVWYHVNGEPDKESDGAQADDERLGTGYSFTLNESLINSGDYYATVDVSSSPAGRLCPDMMRSKIVHFASTRAAMPPMLTPALVRPSEPQHILRLDPEFPTTVTIYDLSGHLLRTFSEEGVDRMDLQAESVAGSYQVVVQNGDLRTVLRYIVVQ